MVLNPPFMGCTGFIACPDNRSMCRKNTFLSVSYQKRDWWVGGRSFFWYDTDYTVFVKRNAQPIAKEGFVGHIVRHLNDCQSRWICGQIPKEGLLGPCPTILLLRAQPILLTRTKIFKALFLQNTPQYDKAESDLCRRQW